MVCTVKLPSGKVTNLHFHQQAVLAREGHEVILEKIEDWNVVELMVNEEVVFHCNIKDLEFGGDGKLDPLCEKARIAVLNAY
nr:UPF0728 protein C10orf53 homolog isoform X2 [Microcebus murinus]